jgi:hypothetical protein
LPAIPSSNASKKACCPKRIYRRRHKIENYFRRIKDWRRIATRYNKLARNYFSAAAIISAIVWITLWVQTLVASDQAGVAATGVAHWLMSMTSLKIQIGTLPAACFMWGMM